MLLIATTIYLYIYLFVYVSTDVIEKSFIVNTYVKFYHHGTSKTHNHF